MCVCVYPAKEEWAGQWGERSRHKSFNRNVLRFLCEATSGNSANSLIFSFALI